MNLSIRVRHDSRIDIDPEMSREEKISMKMIFFSEFGESSVRNESYLCLYHGRPL